jgi:hypothetical protein
MTCGNSPYFTGELVISNPVDLQLISTVLEHLELEFCCLDLNGDDALPHSSLIHFFKLHTFEWCLLD